jgi:hypothetical protein
VGGIGAGGIRVGDARSSDDYSIQMLIGCDNVGGTSEHAYRISGWGTSKTETD